MTLGYPKPAPREKSAPRPLQRSRMKARRSPYQSKEWRALRAECKRNAKGICQLCGKRPGTQAHHTRYGPGRGLSRIIVPVEWLLWTDDDCHQAQHPIGVKQVKVKLSDGGYRYDSPELEMQCNTIR